VVAGDVGQQASEACQPLGAEVRVMAAAGVSLPAVGTSHSNQEA